MTSSGGCGGAGVARATPNVLICWYLRKSPVNPGENGAQRCLTSKKWCPRFA